MSAWKKVILDNSMQPIQQYSGTTGKNSSDAALIIDAMDLLYLGRLDGFCIATSDSDYTRLAARLRESEMYVLGMGEQKTPRAFISACDKFSYLDLLLSASGNGAAPAEKGRTPGPGKSGKPEETAPAEKEPVAVRDESEKADENLGSNIQIVKQALQQLVKEKSDDDGWIFSGKLGSLISKQLPDFDVRNFGCDKFFPFIESLGIFEHKRDDNDRKLIYFRLKQKTRQRPQKGSSAK